MVRPGLPLWAVPGPCARERNCSQGLESPGVGNPSDPAPRLGLTFAGEGMLSLALAHQLSQTQCRSGPPHSLLTAH